jgi:hypothetical protein
VRTVVVSGHRTVVVAAGDHLRHSVGLLHPGELLDEVAQDGIRIADALLLQARRDRRTHVLGPGRQRDCSGGHDERADGMQSARHHDRPVLLGDQREDPAEHEHHEEGDEDEWPIGGQGGHERRTRRVLTLATARDRLCDNDLVASDDIAKLVG